jgi:hypothetical protein
MSRSTVTFSSLLDFSTINDEGRVLWLVVVIVMVIGMCGPLL